MPATCAYPDSPALTQGLEDIFYPDQTPTPAVSLLERTPIIPSMTFPAEIVTCRAAAARLRLFCKHQAGRDHNCFGHRGGLGYEAEVYRRLLQSLPISSPKFYGAYRDATTGEFCLVLGYLEGGILLRDLHLDLEAKPQPTAMGLAARWIGRFHALGEAWLKENHADFLNRHDPDYYAGWARRTGRFSKPLARRFPWLRDLCARATQLLEPLLTAPPAIIHGEFYENNIVVCGRRIFPTDWESAAIAAGEIDLASLTEGKWAPEMVRQCEAEYRRARWPDGAPAEFERRLQAAKLYLNFRWLGERPEWATRRQSLWRYHALYASARSAGFI